METHGFRMTYTVVTHESAEDGDFADVGYVGEGGWRHSTIGLFGDDPRLQDAARSAEHWLEPECIAECEHDARRAEPCIHDFISEAVDYLRREGVTEASTSGPVVYMTTSNWFSVTIENCYNGESETLGFHPIGQWTNEALREICARLRLR